MLQNILEIWPVFLFIAAIGWGLTETYFLAKNNRDKVERIEGRIEKNEDTMNLIKVEIHQTMKENSNRISQNFEKLTEAVTELVTTTQVMATKIEFLRDEKAKGCQNNCNSGAKPARTRRSSKSMD